MQGIKKRCYFVRKHGKSLTKWYYFIFIEYIHLDISQWEGGINLDSSFILWFIRHSFGMLSHLVVITLKISKRAIHLLMQLGENALIFEQVAWELLEVLGSCMRERLLEFFVALGVLLKDGTEHLLYLGVEVAVAGHVFAWAYWVSYL